MFVQPDVLAKHVAQGALLGQGGFGSVYKIMYRGRKLAVKELNMDEKSDGASDFLRCMSPLGAAIANTVGTCRREVTVLATIRHPCIVALVGVSCNATQRLLLFELMERGNVADRLILADRRKIAATHSRGNGKNKLPAELPFTWIDRFCTLIDSALGLACLHECELLHCGEYHLVLMHFSCIQLTYISHCIIADIKPENVLIRANHRAALADFGLARSHSAALSQPDWMGFTVGYADPHWAKSQLYTCKSDVYAMGVMYLEVVTGNRVGQGKPEFRDGVDIPDPKAFWPEDVARGTQPTTYECCVMSSPCPLLLYASITCND